MTQLSPPFGPSFERTLVYLVSVLQFNVWVFGVWDLGFRVWDLKFGIQGSGFRV